MPNYVDLVIDGRTTKFCQLDDGSLVTVSVFLSLEGGTLIKMRPDQLEQLTPIFPEHYLLSPTQVADLKLVQVANFPTAFNVANFPTAFNVANLPSSYPLPLGQEAILTAIRQWVESLTKGAGAVDPNTLRVIQGHQTVTVMRVGVTAATTAKVIAAANASRQSLKIYNDSTAILYLGMGATNPTSTDFSIKLYQDDYYDALPNEARLEFRGIWSAATGAARVTEGI